MTATQPRNFQTQLNDAQAAMRNGDIFAAEHAAIDAMVVSHRTAQYRSMAEAVRVLRDARAAKWEQARAANRVEAIGEYDALHESAEPGCYLIEPPLVGADGRNFRERANAEGVPVLVVTHEPLTQTGLWPIVAVGPSTVRARVKPVAELSPSWFLEAIETLGSHAFDNIDPDDELERRIQSFVDAIAGLPESLALHDALIDVCAAG